MLLRVLVERPRGLALVDLAQFDLDVLREVLVAEYNVVRVLRLVEGQALHIGVNLLGLSVVGEDGLGRPQLKLVVDVISLGGGALRAQVPRAIVVKLLLVRGAPEGGAAREARIFLLVLGGLRDGLQAAQRLVLLLHSYVSINL